MKKTQMLITGVMASLVAGTLAGCSQNLPPKPNDKSCSNWEWDDDLGVWKCDDSHSSHFGHYYYGGRSYSSRSVFKNSSAFKSYKSSSSFKGGFGSGTKGGFGG